jgi:NAD-dependent deacetylase
MEWIRKSASIVFFGGAGVSTESGIPDFRSAGGLFSRDFGASRPEDILHVSHFRKHTDLFFKYYFSHLIHVSAKPNAAHRALAELEKAGRVKAVVTQNIDGLHQEAGSKTVLELHGTVHRNNCTKCRKVYSLENIMPEPDNAGYIPYCTCGGVIKPDVVLYGEQLDEGVLHEAVYHISRADLFIVGGTSLSVYPAASLVQYFSGNIMALINRDQTQYDAKADIILREPIGQVLGAVYNPPPNLKNSNFCFCGNNFP